jgi:hypothetical protein
LEADAIQYLRYQQTYDTGRHLCCHDKIAMIPAIVNQNSAAPPCKQVSDAKAAHACSAAVILQEISTIGSGTDSETRARQEQDKREARVDLAYDAESSLSPKKQHTHAQTMAALSVVSAFSRFSRFTRIDHLTLTH